MSDVFISYSRKDIAFARLLNKALEESELETWIDWQDIPTSADWLTEVYEAAQAADIFIFLISDTSVARISASSKFSMPRRITSG